MVVDAYNDPYGQRAEARKKRVEFNRQKQTDEFKRWRKWQWRIQSGQCAYCRIHLDLKWIVTHVDHVTPLFHEGKNEFANYVLSCRRCNVRKWVSNAYIVPRWIKDNESKILQSKRLKMARRKQKELMQQLVDEQIFSEIMEHI